MTAIYFCVERGPGGAEMPAIIHDLLPERLAHKGSNPLVYALRLDLLPNGAALIAKPLADLFALYRQLRDAGKLPLPNLGLSAKKGGATGRRLGDWWIPPDYSSTQPAEPWPEPGTIAARPKAGAFIGPAQIDEEQN